MSFACPPALPIPNLSFISIPSPLPPPTHLLQPFNHSQENPLSTTNTMRKDSIPTLPPPPKSFFGFERYCTRLGGMSLESQYVATSAYGTLLAVGRNICFSSKVHFVLPLLSFPSFMTPVPLFCIMSRGGLFLRGCITPLGDLLSPVRMLGSAVRVLNGTGSLGIGHVWMNGTMLRRVNQLALWHNWLVAICWSFQSVY